MINTFKTEIIPANETERLNALRRYEILDTPPEEAFNNLAHIIQQVFDVPIALISLVDEERVFFKANVGMGNIKYTERGVSLCSLAVMSSEPTVFNNALTEPCLLANPLVTGQFGLRFYAGSPLVTHDGFNIGTVCIVDKKQRDFTEKQKGLLKRFAANVMHEIELRLAAKKRTDELKKMVDEQTNELLEVNSMLSNSNKELERTNFELEQYAYAASHDLQEPLRKIQTFSDIINTKYSSDIKNGAQVYLNKISDAAARMSGLIRDVLDLSKLRGNQEFREVDLNEVWAGLLQTFEIELQQKKANIKVESLPVVKALSVQMTQLFHNLLSNALKFSQTGKPVEIRVSCSKLPANDERIPMFSGKENFENYYIITFSDNGIGFNPKYADKIFGLFNRLHHLSDFSGNGIGLALCRKIVNNHNGTIWADSTEGQGATFYIVLPAIG